MELRTKDRVTVGSVTPDFTLPSHSVLQRNWTLFGERSAISYQPSAFRFWLKADS
jgi:hypothetical protein